MTLHDIMSKISAIHIPAVAALACVSESELRAALAEPQPTEGDRVEPSAAFAAALFHEAAEHQQGSWPHDLRDLAVQLQSGAETIADLIVRKAIARVNGGPPAKPVGETIGNEPKRGINLAEFAAALFDQIAAHPDAVGWSRAHFRGGASAIRNGTRHAAHSILQLAVAATGYGTAEPSELTAISKALDDAFGDDRWRTAGGPVRAIRDLADMKYTRGHTDGWAESEKTTHAESYAKGLFAVAEALGWDNDGDPVAWAKAYRERTDAWEAEVSAFHSAMARLGVDVPEAVSDDGCVVTAVCAAIAEYNRKNAIASIEANGTEVTLDGDAASVLADILRTLTLFRPMPAAITSDALIDLIQILASPTGPRSHSVTLHQIDHVLQAKDGPVPMAPYPEGADDGDVLRRVQVAVDGLRAAADALGKLTAAKRRIVRAVGISYGRGVQPLAIVDLIQAIQARGLTDVRVGGPVWPADTAALHVRGEDTVNGVRVTHVRENGQRFDVDDWLASIEGRSDAS